MNQPIANITLILDRNGSNVQRQNVTPAEVMLLCAMHHKNAGKDPIQDLKVIPEGAFDENIEKEEKALTKLSEDYAKVEVDPTLLEDVREKRLESIKKRMEVKESTIDGLKQIGAIRDLSPSDEYRRLSFRYNNITLSEFYPGRIPSLPSTFEEARKQGTQTGIVEAKWIVGDNKYSK